MIIVKISGGLGNQLFQYYFGQYLSMTLNTNVLYDIQTNTVKKSITSRCFSLIHFNIEVNQASVNDIVKINKYYKGYIARIQRKISLFFPSFIKRLIVENNNIDLYDEIKIKDNCYYDGYWQNYCYLMQNNKKINQSISIEKEIIDKNDLLIKEINDNLSVSIHIRRSDYLLTKKNRKIYNICDFNYYERAIEYIKSKYSDIKFYVFSDDIEWTKQNFVGSEYCIIEGNEDYFDMYLMSLCKHNIIANSTFSWWAAWFNSNPNKIIISPKSWFKPDYKKNINYLIPSSWIKI